MKNTDANNMDYNGRILFSALQADQLSKEKISIENVNEVIDFCEHTGRKVYHPDRGTYSGYKEIGYITCWVEYKADKDEGRFKLVDVYSHRMQIKL